MNARWLIVAVVMLALAACSSAPPKKSSAIAGTRVQGHGAVATSGDCIGYAAATEDPSTRGHYTAGGLYKPGVQDSIPDELPRVNCIPEPVVTDEPRAAYGNKSPYEVLGKKYKVLKHPKGYVERGTASYYGAKFHGRLTSDHEVYDMYAFTAAHKTLPLPSFALVTNLDNGKSVVVRVNDRGPFHDGRLIDLSYAAAAKIGIVRAGTGHVEVRALTTDDNEMLAERRKAQGGGTVVAAQTPSKQAEPAATPVAHSQIDRLVQQLPAAPADSASAAKAGATQVKSTEVAGASAAARSATAEANPAEQWRYRVADSKHPGSADNFDAWMKQRGIHVATGKPASVTVAASSAVAAAAQPDAAEAAASATSAAAPVSQSGTRRSENAVSGNTLDTVLLQVASFASRENADRALSQLSAAGIVGASLSDIVSGGRTLWRLRVNASDLSAASELARQIAGLGFGHPQILAR